MDRGEQECEAAKLVIMRHMMRIMRGNGSDLAILEGKFIDSATGEEFELTLTAVQITQPKKNVVRFVHPLDR